MTALFPGITKIRAIIDRDYNAAYLPSTVKTSSTLPGMPPHWP
jgi:hypothetical protein